MIGQDDELERLLRAATEDEVESLREAKAAAPEPDEDAQIDRFRAQLERAYPPPAPAARPVRYRRLQLAAAALVLVASGAWLASRGTERAPATPPTPGPIALGSAAVRLETPNGPDADFSVFRWSAEPDLAAFTLKVWNADDPTEPVIVQRDLEGYEYRPTTAERETLGREIVWTVYPQDSTRTARAAPDQVHATRKAQ